MEDFWGKIVPTENRRHESLYSRYKISKEMRGQ